MTEPSRPYRILMATGEQGHMRALLAIAEPLARTRGGHVIPLYVGTEESPPSWLYVPEDLRDVVDEPQVVHGANAGRGILRCARELEPDLLLLHWKGERARGRYLLGPTLDPVIQQAPCHVAVVRVGPDPDAFVERLSHLRRILVPSSGGPNAELALSLGLDLGPDVMVTALRVARQPLGPTAISAQWEILRTALSRWEDEPRLERRVNLAGGIASGITEEAGKGYDLVMLGATRESFVDRLIFGNLPQSLAVTVREPLVIIKQRDTTPAAAIRRARWWLLGVMPQLSLEERIGIYRSVRRKARTDTDFYVMMILAAAIASLGLLLSSPAVIIGAMLVAPLMSTLVGVGLAIVQGDGTLLRLSSRTLVVGTFLVIVVSGVISALVPSNEITAEMAARGSPTLLDLAVALVSGAAAAYAIARGDAASALPGVAIAVALVPPLATIGLAAVSGAGQVALGATLLFSTNLVAIVSAVALMFLWMGFHPNIREEIRARTFHGGLLSTGLLLITITVILTSLSLSSVKQASEKNMVQKAVVNQVTRMGPEVELESWQIVGEEQGRALVRLTLRTSRDIYPVEIAQFATLAQAYLGRPVTVSTTLVRFTQVTASSD